MSPSTSAPTPSSVTASSSPRIGSDFFDPHTRRGARSPAIEALEKGGKGINAVRGLKVLDHSEFLERWGEVEMTRTRDGSNPMVDSYQNAKFIL